MNYLKTAILFGGLGRSFGLFGRPHGRQAGRHNRACVGRVMNFGTYWFSDKIVLAMYRAKLVDEKTEPELYSMVRDLSQKAGLPMPKVYTMENDTPNAFATGRNPSHAAIAVTTGIRSLLNKNELRGVLAHELSHIQNRDILIATLAATIAGAISYLSHMACGSASATGTSAGGKPDCLYSHDDCRAFGRHDYSDGNIALEGIRRGRRRGEDIG